MINSLIVAFPTTLAIVVTYLLSRKRAVVVAEKVDTVATVAANTAADTTSKLDEIHVLVNSRLSEALARIESLERALGIPANAPAPAPKEST